MWWLILNKALKHGASSGRGVKWLIGVDEAGRGSVVGELVVAAFAVDIKKLRELEELGVRDSKKLTRDKRKIIFNKLWEIGRFSVKAIQPSSIDESNINELEAKAAAETIHNLLYNILDLKENDMERVRIIIDKFGLYHVVVSEVAKVARGAEIRVEEKADSRYLEVSAASIVAKHLRDERIEVLRNMYGVRGSGYPSDPATLRWLEEFLARHRHGRVDFIRYSWGTIKRLGGPWIDKKGKQSRRVNIRSLDEFLK